MRGFDFLSPTSLTAALRAIDETGRNCKILAGGTNVIPDLRSGGIRPRWVVDLGRVKGARLHTGRQAQHKSRGPYDHQPPARISRYSKAGPSSVGSDTIIRRPPRQKPGHCGRKPRGRLSGGGHGRSLAGAQRAGENSEPQRSAYGTFEGLFFGLSKDGIGAGRDPCRNRNPSQPSGDQIRLLQARPAKRHGRFGCECGRGVEHERKDMYRCGRCPRGRGANPLADGHGGSAVKGQKNRSGGGKAVRRTGCEERKPYQ